MRRVLDMLYENEEETGRRGSIVSGHRTLRLQRCLGQSGRPTADPSRSTHTTCPATGVDVGIGLAPTRVQKAILGRIARLRGLRWGGGSPVDDNGIPSDWNHFDVGPRGGPAFPSP